MNGPNIKTYVDYNPKENKFNTSGIDKLDLPEEKKEKLYLLFEDFSTEPTYKKLSNEAFVRCAMILLIVLTFLLFFFVIVQTQHPTKHIMKAADNSQKKEAFALKNDVRLLQEEIETDAEDINDEKEDLNPDKDGTEIDKEPAESVSQSKTSPIVFEVFIFLCVFSIVLILILLSIQQILVKNSINILKASEKETLEAFKKHFLNAVHIEPEMTRRKILKYFSCFHVFDFKYLLVVLGDEESKILSLTDTNVQSSFENSEAFGFQSFQDGQNTSELNMSV